MSSPKRRIIGLQDVIWGPHARALRRHDGQLGFETAFVIPISIFEDIRRHVFGHSDPIYALPPPYS